LIEGTMLVGLHTTWSAGFCPQAKNPSYAPDFLWETHLRAIQSVTCSYMGSPVTCHPSQVNTLRSQTGQYTRLTKPRGMEG